MIQSLPRAAGCYATTTQFLRELREAMRQRASIQGVSLMGPGQEGGDCGSTSPRSLDELAQLRTHTAHYSPVIIAPLSTNSSRHCPEKKIAEPSFFSTAQGVGFHGRRRNGRARIARSRVACRAGTARQSHLCYQLQFAAQAIFVAVSAPKMISTLKK
jgi:hypothetical protein